ncbi:MAG TPA: chromosome segregation protein SMC [Dictyobacter sp.]|nr:chromosome segregation protein SMC [Dictyobacter sp.]
MYLKRLDMLGFKSFAVRTQLEFSSGITAVVGPNGAGKSNVADSIRWVLGEQSMRQLRGKKSEDIIFAGSQGRAALGMAEVSLTLDNSTGWVPSEYSEITVTRRSFRSGENEYLINKQKVRLKDVLLLLAQARIGHDSYTVIGQGLIDSTLSLRAEERRGLFEDAAGIRPFQVQRTDAENRLRQTEQNLERLRDIVNEIEPRLKPLAEQAKRAVEYLQLTAELQKIQRLWYGLQWRRLQSSREQAERHEQEQAQKAQQHEEALQVLVEQIKGHRTHRQATQRSLSDIRQSLGNARDRVQQLECELAIDQERTGSFERQRGDLQQEERHLRERLITLQKHLIDLEEQCDLANEGVDDGSAKLAASEARVAKAQQEYEMDERRLRSVQRDLLQVQSFLGAAQSEFARLQKQLTERQQSLTSRRNTIAQAQEKERSVNERLTTEIARQAIAHEEEKVIAQRKQSLMQQINEAQQEMERMKTMLSEAERRKRTTLDRLTMVKNWRQSLSGYSDGVRALLRAPAGKVSGMIGPVPQLGVVPVALERAMGVALRSYMQAVVVQTLRDAQQCLDYLRSSQAGKAIVVWLTREEIDDDAHEVNIIQEQVEEMVLQRFLHTLPEHEAHVSGFAWRLIECEQSYRAFFRRLMHGIVIVRDMSTALVLLEWLLQLSASSDSDLPFTAVVTLDGEMLHVDGWLTSGGQDGAQQGLLAHERELRELPQHLTEIETVIAQVHDMISAVQRSQEGRRVEQHALDKELHKSHERLKEIDKVVQAAQRELERIQTEVRLASSVEQQFAAEVVSIEQDMLTLQARIREQEKLQREQAGLAEELQFELEERAISYRRQQDTLGQERTALAVRRQEARSLRQQLSQQQGQAKDIRARIDQQVARIRATEQQQQVLQTTIVQHRHALGQAQQQVQELAECVQISEQQMADIDQQIATLEQQQGIVQHSAKEQETLYRRSLLERQKARDAVDALLVQLRDELDISDPHVLEQEFPQEVQRVGEGSHTDQHNAQGHPLSAEQRSAVIPVLLTEEEETQLKRYRRRIETLRSRLKAMGGCDTSAPQVYEETKIRYEFLSGQIGDMDQAALQLHEIIDQLDATMSKQFEATFQAVNARFREHFTTLFNGGTARLELVRVKESEEDVVVSSAMPSGVDVIVQPPGKKVQDLSLLSGGERSLVAAALLFSLLEINPPPFCLLDEVDAALDESNVTRFCDILKRLAERTQFIVITHNRVTMTAAQVIYGVSMRESVSHLLSMRLEEAAVGVGR